VANDGVLTAPESGSRPCVYVDRERVSLWIYHDAVWFYVPMFRRAAWILSDNYYEMFLNKPQPADAVEGGIGEYDNSTGTVTMLFSRLLRLPDNIEANALQMRPGERWIMGFLLELGYMTNTGTFTDYVDGWPNKTYPYMSDDASWWPKLVIDLTNPQPTYPAMSEVCLEFREGVNDVAQVLMKKENEEQAAERCCFLVYERATDSEAAGCFP